MTILSNVLVRTILLILVGIVDGIRRLVGKENRRPWIHTVVTHHNPHWDECCGFWLLLQFGWILYRGLRTARVEFRPKTNLPQKTQAVDGFLFIGTGGGEHDEHGTTETLRKEDECAATLVAKALGVDQDPALERILRFALDNDLTAFGHPFDVANHLKEKWLEECKRNSPRKIRKILRWVFKILDTRYVEQKRFHEKAGPLFRDPNVTEVCHFKGPRFNHSPESLPVAFIQSDDPRVGKYARSQHGCSAAVTVVCRSTKNVQIHVNGYYRLGNVADRLVSILRARECELQGMTPPDDLQVLACKDVMSGLEEWHYTPKTNQGMILNGSPNTLGVSPTQIPWNEFKKIVEIALDPEAFYEPECQEGRCEAFRGFHCPWDCYKLPQCRKNQKSEKARQTFGDSAVTEVRYLKGPQRNNLPEKLPVAFIQSDNYGVRYYAFSRDGCEAAVVVLKRTSGHVHIFVNEAYGVRVGDNLAKLMRVLECAATDRSVPDGPARLAQEGTLPEIPEWHYVRRHKGDKILNELRQEPTSIPLGVIRHAMAVALDPRKFNPEYEENCRRGFCYANCSWRAGQLSRCCKVREEMVWHVRCIELRRQEAHRRYLEKQQKSSDNGDLVNFEEAKAERAQAAG